MKSRPSVAFLLMGWLGSLGVLAAAASIGLVIAQVLFWPVLALGAAAFALAAGVNREGAARWFVLAPGLVGPVLVLYGAVTGVQGPAAVVYYIGIGAWLVALVAALITKGGDAG